MNTSNTSFPKRDYETVFCRVLSDSGLTRKDISPRQWISWQTQLKRLFRSGITVSEILSALPEAYNVRRWPSDARLWRRVEDVCLERRRHRRPVVRVDSGIQDMRSLLTEKRG